MTEFFYAVLEYQFLQYAVLACLLASVGCGVVGSYVVIKKLGSLAGGIAHAVLAGMGIAYFFGQSPLLGATIMSLVSAVFIGMVNLRLKQNEDILVAAFWSVGMAIGILFISRTPGYNINLMKNDINTLATASQINTVEIQRIFTDVSRLEKIIHNVENEQSRRTPFINWIEKHEKNHHK